MRIIGGKYKSRSIVFNKKIKARPTTDSAKEALFNILENKTDLDEIEVLDLFAGTGSIAYEFMSRGAKKVTCIDQQLSAVKFINEQAEKWSMNIKTIKTNVFPYIVKESKTYDIIFADPPYDHEKAYEIPEIIFNRQLLKNEGWLILEHSKKLNFYKSANFIEQRTYSNVNFSFFNTKQNE